MFIIQQSINIAGVRVMSNFEQAFFNFVEMQQERIKSLDGLRGIAILLVLTFHLLSFGPLTSVFMFGWMGVDLFFVLSGFLITGILIDTKNEKAFYKTFLIRRALRILPLYYAVVIAFALIAPLFQVTSWFEKYQFYFWTHTSNYLFLTHGFFKPLGHFWSLAIEEQFYLVWPFVVLFLTPKLIIRISLLLIAVGIYLRLTIENKYLTYGLPFAHLDGLLIGAIISFYYKSNKDLLFNYSKQFLFVCAVVFFFFLVYGVLTGNNLHENPFSFTIASIFFGSLLVACIAVKNIANALSNKVLLFFGKYSYGMYIFNSIFYHYSSWWYINKLSEMQKLLMYAVVFILTVIVSYLSYNLFEVRFLRLKERWALSIAK